MLESFQQVIPTTSACIPQEGFLQGTWSPRPEERSHFNRYGAKFAEFQVYNVCTLSVSWLNTKYPTINFPQNLFPPRSYPSPRKPRTKHLPALVPAIILPNELPLRFQKVFLPTLLDISRSFYSKSAPSPAAAAPTALKPSIIALLALATVMPVEVEAALP